jgi:hypothetical protein
MLLAARSVCRSAEAPTSTRNSPSLILRSMQYTVCAVSSRVPARRVLVGRSVTGGLEQSQQLQPSGEPLAFVVSLAGEHSLDPPALQLGELQDKAHR